MATRPVRFCQDEPRRSSRSHGSKPPINSFEANFQVPAAHRLVSVRSRGRGGHVPATFWEHEEYDASGRLSARYVSYVEGAPGLDGARSGWRKYDVLGVLVDRGSSLPSDLREAA